MLFLTHSVKGAKGFLPEVPVNAYMEKTAKQRDNSNVDNTTDEYSYAEEVGNSIFILFLDALQMQEGHTDAAAVPPGPSLQPIKGI